MTTDHRLEATNDTTVVGVFDRSRAPVMTIEPGETVNVETATHWGDAITPNTTLEDIIKLRTEKFPDVGPHTLTGPIEVKGAQRGQTLRVDILKLVPRTHGFNLFYPGSFGTGLLPEDFEAGRLRHFDHDLDRMMTEFGAGIRIPLSPFLGIMGVAPEASEQLSTVPPGVHGGNMDLPELTDGATLFLPIWVDGAMFSTGDAHSRQGHGEVCLTAIETAMRQAHLRFSVVDDWRLERPCAETSEYWITMGFDEDLLLSAKTAVRDMIRLLGEKFGLDAGDAYSLCSVAVDLSVTQVVNKVRGVHARVAKSLFEG